MLLPLVEPKPHSPAAAAVTSECSPPVSSGHLPVQGSVLAILPRGPPPCAAPPTHRSGSWPPSEVPRSRRLLGEAFPDPLFLEPGLPWFSISSSGHVTTWRRVLSDLCPCPTLTGASPCRPVCPSAPVHRGTYPAALEPGKGMFRTRDLRDPATGRLCLPVASLSWCPCRGPDVRVWRGQSAPHRQSWGTRLCSLSCREPL